MENLAILGATAVVVATCVACGSLGARFRRRRAWSWTHCVLVSVSTALIWPALLMGSVARGAASSGRDGPSATCGTPVIAFFAASLILFGVGVQAAYLAYRRAWKRRPAQDSTTPPPA